LAVLPAALYALPLLWRRQSPWQALLGVLAAAWLAPAALGLGLMEWEEAWALGIGGALAESVALYSIAAYAGRARDTWAAIVVTAAGAAPVLVVLAELSDPTDDVDDPAAFLAFMTVLGTALLVVLLAPVWALGAAVRARRERIRGREHSALAATVQAAVVE
ncbi:hypothetical protein P8605_49990, partial [Streptomyces sp. T-3]|nr:hypothetical protein [Streptomyces sp. T-3]